MDTPRLALRIERAIAAANQAGKLKWFNNAYREHRRNNGRMSYRAARLRLRKAILRRVLQHQPWNTGNLKAEIFGERRAADGSSVRKKESG